MYCFLNIILYTECWVLCSHATYKQISYCVRVVIILYIICWLLQLKSLNLNTNLWSLHTRSLFWVWLLSVKVMNDVAIYVTHVVNSVTNYSITAWCDLFVFPLMRCALTGWEQKLQRRCWRSWLEEPESCRETAWVWRTLPSSSTCQLQTHSHKSTASLTR